MKIEETPNLPWVNEELIKSYLRLLLPKTEYKAYSIDENFNVIEGIGMIDSDGSYNYHNNYDDSKDTLHFEYKNEYKHKVNAQRWWTLNKSEAEDLCLKERIRFMAILYKQIEKLS